MEARPNRPLGNSKRLRYFGMLQALDGEEREDRLLILREASDGPPQAIVRGYVPIPLRRHGFQGPSAERVPTLSTRPFPKTDVKRNFHEPRH